MFWQFISQFDEFSHRVVLLELHCYIFSTFFLCIFIIFPSKICIICFNFQNTDVITPSNRTNGFCPLFLILFFCETWWSISDWSVVTNYPQKIFPIFVEKKNPAIFALKWVFYQMRHLSNAEIFNAKSCVELWLTC